MKDYTKIEKQKRYTPMIGGYRHICINYHIFSLIVPYSHLFARMHPYYPLLSLIIPYYHLLSRIVTYYPLISLILAYCHLLSPIITYYPLLNL